MKIIPSAAYILFFGFLAGCSSFDRSETDHTEATVIEKPYTDVEAEDLDSSEYVSFRNNAEQEISKNEGIIGKLKDALKTQKEDRRAEYQRRIDTLENRNRNLRLKVIEYKHTTKAEWDSFKREMKSDLEGLGRALENFADNNSE